MSQATIMRNVSYRDYCLLPGVRTSDLKLFKKSPLHARYAMLHPTDSTPAMARGTALHTLVLQPEKFAKEYAVGPKVDKRTKAGKNEWDAFELANQNKTLLNEVEFSVIEAMKRAVYEHAWVQAIVQLPSLREFVVAWEDIVPGIAAPVVCKALVDLAVQADDSIVVDLKSTSDASPDEFARSINKYSYHASAAAYLRGLQKAHPIAKRRRFVWIAVESEAPYGVAVYEASEGLLEQGELEYLSWQRQYAECTARSQWPGYPQQVQPIDLPKWAWKDVEVSR